MAKQYKNTVKIAKPKRTKRTGSAKKRAGSKATKRIY